MSNHEEKREKEKKTVILSAADLIRKKFGREITPAGTSFDKIPESISSGSILLDNALGRCKGYPFGSVIEAFGWEGAGKTLMLYLAFAEAQKKYPNRPCVLIDAERQFEFQAEWARKLGVDVSKLIVLKCSTAEECFDMIYALILGEHEIDKKSGEVTKVHTPGNYAIIGIDSVTQLVSLTDATKGMDDTRQRASQASAIGLGLKKVSSAMARSDVNAQTILFFINQLRKNPNKMFGNPEYRTGGNALPFYDTIAIKVAKVWDSEERDENDEILSHDVKITFEKNKAGSCPSEAIVFTLMHDGTGVNNEGEMFNVAMNNGILKEFTEGKAGKEKTRYNFVDPDSGELLNEDIKNFAKRSLNSVLEEHPELKSKIQELIEEKKIFVKKDEIKEFVPESAAVVDENDDDDDSDETAFTDKTDDEENDDKKPERKKKVKMKLR
jgi:protein RecA